MEVKACKKKGSCSMLETRELTKIYKPKKGVAVTALDKISLKFPETGMVFLLGKSGSGKSTLLNLLGGLDKYDGGEIIIKGVSSKDFNQQHFDSYRNTYVGFIFQEYNILDEFSVGANIALALELQGKKASDDEINNILKEVDLEGYGNRKPNELSGGQKQRVAIARALVKNPEIIMADEPTGALDSNTGRQVFDTLKKLSKKKLVIIVSHDREFSELYADRIIELADGKVISDVELVNDQKADETEENIVFSEDTVELAAGYHLTEEDRAAINKYIDEVAKDGLKIKTKGGKTQSKKFVKTNVDNIKEQDGSTFKLIKSKLPLKSGFKIGASGLKYKKFKLVMTILLSCISFGLFGLADTFGSYNHVKTCTNSLIDTGVDYVSLVKAVKMGHGMNQYYDTSQRYLNDNDINAIEKEINRKFVGVVNPINSSMDFSESIDMSTKFSETEYVLYTSSFSGFGEITKEKLDEFGYSVLAGKLPDGSKNEIAISKYIYETFHIGKYTDGKVVDSKGDYIYEDINSYEDLIGKTIEISDTTYTITGIIDTKLDFDRYSSLMEKKDYSSTSDRLVDFVLANEFYYTKYYSLASVAMVGSGHMENIIEKCPKISPLRDKYMYLYSDYDGAIDPYYISKLDDIDKNTIMWLDGEKASLGEKEIIISSDIYYGREDDLYYDRVDSDSEGDGSSYVDKLKKADFTINLYSNYSEDGNDRTESGYKVVGIFDPENDKSSKYSGTIVTTDSIYNECVKYEYGVYDYAVTSMPKDRKNIEDMVAYCYNGDLDVRYELQNAVTYELDTINSVFKVMSKIFLYVGIGFAVFASLMLANFIATSISYKKQEIGILRAIGSRSNDVFRIFFSESFIIAIINFVLSSIGVFAFTTIINTVIRNELGVLITVLRFGIRQILLLFVVSIAVAFLASFLPVRKIASKKPIDAIRNR